MQYQLLYRKCPRPAKRASTLWLNTTTSERQSTSGVLHNHTCRVPTVLLITSPKVPSEKLLWDIAYLYSIIVHDSQKFDLEEHVGSYMPKKPIKFGFTCSSAVWFGFTIKIQIITGLRMSKNVHTRTKYVIAELHWSMQQHRKLSIIFSDLVGYHFDVQLWSEQTK